MSGIDNLNARMRILGSNPEGRLKKIKLDSFHSALKNSYQSAWITKTSDGEGYQCLINPDQIKPDYDNKVISIDFQAGIKAGETFHWLSNNTYWLVYLGELTETAYFRGYIRRCRHKLVINNIDYYVYVDGPTAKDMKWISGAKRSVEFNQLSGTLSMYVKKTPDSLDFFKLFNIVELDGQSWQVEATDTISIEGIIEVDLGEFFNDPLKKLQQVPVVTPIDTTIPHIEGDRFVRPYATAEYTIALNTDLGEWNVSNASAHIISSTLQSAVIEVVSGKSGTFDVIYTQPGGNPNISLKVTIESL